MANEHELKTIVLRDLEPLLRKSIDERLIVDNFTTESLLPPGENYGSTILSVHAVVRKNEDAPKEDLFLIAKMSPPTDYQKRIFDSAYTFRKETHMYVDILPAYNKFEIECGIKEDEVFDILPKFYGMRLSLDPDSDLDDDAVILLENLKKKGYYIGKRAIGYDYEHSKIAVQAMARFHALGIAMKNNRPETFEILKGYSKCLEIKGNDFDNLLDMMLARIQEDPLLKPYYERCTQLLNDISMKDVWLGSENDPWCTIIHADFWVNNIMFHRGEDGKVDDIKFVDFQNYLLICPLRELIFYLYTSGDEEVQKNHIDEFIDLYHDCFIGHLRRYGCDTTEFTKEKMHERIRGDARLEYVRVAFITKILTLNVQETKFEYTETKDIMINYQGNEQYSKRMHQIFVNYTARGWM